MKLLKFFRRMNRPYQVIAAALVVLAALVLYARWDAYGTVDTNVAYTVMPPKPRGAEELIVFAHGYAKGVRPLKPLIEAVRAARPDADLMVFDHAAQVFSNASPFRLAAQMEEHIRLVSAARGYKRIHLVGYSMGALLIRKAYVYGAGAVEDWPYAVSGASTRPAQEWVGRVERVVLLAGTNRGWSHEDPPKEMTLMRSMINSLGMFVAKLSGTGRLVREVQRGEPFVANLRLQWLDVMEAAKDPGAQRKQPVVVQFLGDRDDVVSREDNLDVAVAKDFIWVGVSNTNHANIVDIEQPGAGAERKRKILLALGTDNDIATLRETTVAPARHEDHDVTTVVFVLHGIRDMGEWTSMFEAPLVAAFRRAHPGTEKIYVHRAGYDYFGMGPFLLWADRQRNVRWFMDQVTELKSKFPNLEKMHFIGHSNGTYVLASALEKYRTLKVANVVFAGSVVPRNYDWGRYAGRVGNIRNYVGAGDLIVGIFPGVFEFPVFGLINSDLGSAGFNGFQHAFGKRFETQFIKGGHSAALHPSNVQSIVDFIIETKKVDVPELFVEQREGHLALLSRIAWIIWLVLVAVVVLGGVLVYRLAGSMRNRLPGKYLSLAGLRSTFLASYVFVLYMVLQTI